MRWGSINFLVFTLILSPDVKEKDSGWYKKEIILRFVLRAIRFPGEQRVKAAKSLLPENAKLRLNRP